MTTPDIPLLDVSAWRDGTESQRARIAGRIDQALRQSGILLNENHGDPAKPARSPPGGGEPVLRPARGAGRTATPPRRRGRGWLPPGGEANAFYGEVADPDRADMKESLTNGRDFLTEDADIDEAWFAPNVWPAETPDLAALAGEFTGQVRELYYDLLRMSADCARP